jgi:hypothetical protein
MSKNINTIQKVLFSIDKTIQYAGMTAMAMAALVSMVDLPGRPEGKLAVVGQPSFAFANFSQSSENPLRREREESAPHFISYSESQRTPSRSGKQ